MVRWIVKDGKLYTTGLQSRMTKALTMARMRRAAPAPNIPADGVSEAESETSAGRSKPHKA